MGENLAQPNLDGISCIISNIQFHLEKKPDKSPERVENFSLVSSLDPSSSSFQIFFLQRCLTPSRTCFRDAFVFHFRSLLSFLTTISLSFSFSLLVCCQFPQSISKFSLWRTGKISRENSANSHGRGLDKVESLEVSFYHSYVQSG